MKYPILSRQTLLLAACWTLAPLFFIFAVIGGIRYHTAIPFWDMWSGYLDFYVKVNEGHWEQWWTLHNEHRIVLARLLFWMDLAWFQGTVWFLITVNYLLVLVAFLTFRAMLREQAGNGKNTPQTTVLTLLVFMMLFSWVQYDNLTWGFQSQFFLAQLLPLLALYFLYRSTQREGLRHFAVACVFGILSVGSMASGVLALPLMLGYAVVLRIDWKRICILAGLMVFCLGVYFLDYHTPGGHGSVRTAISEHPGQMLTYMLAYLGSPFYYFFPGRYALQTAMAFGLVLIVLSGIKAVHCLKNPRQHALDLCLLVFILHIGGTALATAGGRSLFGVDQATTSRYTTPALMGWTALLVLHAPVLLRSLAHWQRRIVWPIMVLLIVMTPYQAKARRSHHTALYAQELGALAMELGVQDLQQIRMTYFDPPNAPVISRKPSEENLSIFGIAPFKDARQLLGQPAGDLPPNRCEGLIDEILGIEQEKNYKKVRGWVLSKEGNNDFESVRLVDPEGITVGYALMGDARNELRKAYGRKARLRGFSGYIQTSKAHGPLRIVAPEASCNVQTAPPQPPPFRLADGEAQVKDLSVSSNDILSNTGWTGKDYYQSTWPGVKVLGSYISGDADTGSITLRVQPGASLMYRTGPENRHQRITIDGQRPYEGPLPLATQWKTLVFDDTSLTRDIHVTLSDSGTGWGEWSALAVQEKTNDSKKQ